MVAVAVSACLLGENCKYNGGNNRCDALLEALRGHDDILVIPVCPEAAGGLPTPRPPAEIVGGRVLSVNGDDVDQAFRLGSAKELERLRPYIEKGELAAAVLQSRSPSCGVHQVYDGSFEGRLIAGQGVFARDLESRGVKLIDVSDI